jgi:hypothetical protein
MRICSQDNYIIDIPTVTCDMLQGTNSTSNLGKCAFAMTPGLCDTFPGTWGNGGCALDISKDRYAETNVNTIASRDIEITGGDAGEIVGTVAVAGVFADEYSDKFIERGGA